MKKNVCRKVIRIRKISWVALQMQTKPDGSFFPYLQKICIEKVTQICFTLYKEYISSITQHKTLALRAMTLGKV